MFKRLFPLFILVAFLFPQHQALANGNNIYYNEEYKYSISFPGDWYIFSNEMLNQLSPEERQNTSAVFINNTGSSQMFARHLTSDSDKYIFFRDIMNYVKSTPKDKQDLQRELNPVSVELGRTLDDYSIDESNGTIELQFSQTSALYGEIYSTVLWKEYKGALTELEFFQFENSSSLQSETNSIIKSLSFSSESLATNMKEGSVNLLNTKSLSATSNNNVFLIKICGFIKRPIVWISAICFFFFAILLKIIYKLI